MFLAGHFKENPLFWLRGIIKNDVLYVQELQNDHASNYRKEDSRLTLSGELSRTSYRYDIPMEQGLWWDWVSYDAEEAEEIIEDQGLTGAEAEEFCRV